MASTDETEAEILLDVLRKGIIDAIDYVVQDKWLLRSRQVVQRRVDAGGVPQMAYQEEMRINQRTARQFCELGMLKFGRLLTNVLRAVVGPL